MKMLGIYNSKNKFGRKDGDEFEREAEAWAGAQPIDTSLFPTLFPPRLADVRDGRIRREIRGMKNGLDVLAIFDHGTPKGLPRMRESYKCVKGLAETIAGVTDKITIILYCCSCGKGWWWNKLRWLRWRKNKRDFAIKGSDLNPREGYAAVLSAELEKLGVEANIYAHLTWGHCCMLPHVARVTNIGRDAKLISRRHLVTPGTPEWKQWKADMRGPKRFTFWK